LVWRLRLKWAGKMKKGIKWNRQIAKKKWQARTVDKRLIGWHPGKQARWFGAKNTNPPRRYRGHRVRSRFWPGVTNKTIEAVLPLATNALDMAEKKRRAS